MHLVFSDPEVHHSIQGPELFVQETDSTLLIENWPSIPVRKIIRKYPAGTALSVAEATCENVIPLEVKLDLRLDGNSGPRPINYQIPQPVFKPLPSTHLFPEKNLDWTTFRGMDPVSLKPAVWLVVTVAPVQIVNRKKVVFTEEVSFVIHSESNDQVVPEASQRSETVCIICPDMFESSALSLVTHKQTNGINTSLVLLSDALLSGQGTDDPGKLRSFIKTRHETHGTAFFLLLGDADQMPVRYCHQQEDPLGFGAIPTDNYYADLYDTSGQFINWDYDADGRIGEYPDDLPAMDFAPDVFVTRLPVSTEDEVVIALNHIMAYESQPSHADDWFNTVLFAAVDTFNEEAHGETSGMPEGERFAERICQDTFTTENIIRLYETETYFRDDEALPENIPIYSSSGVGFMAFHCHGAPDCMQLSNYDCFDHENTSAMANGNKLPLVYGFACSTAAFDNELPDYPYSQSYESMAEKFLLNPNGGAITYIGSTRVAVANGGHDETLSGSGSLEYYYWNAIKEGLSSTGAAYARAQIAYLQHVGVAGYYNYMTLMEHNSFGDPSVSIGGFIQGKDVRVINKRQESLTTLNQCISPDDSGALYLEVISQGNTIQDPEFRLTPVSPDVTMIVNSHDPGSLGRLETVVLPPFTFQVDSVFQDDSMCQFTLEIFEDSVMVSNQVVTAYIGSGSHLEFSKINWLHETHKNGHADPGETLYLAAYGSNSGCLDLIAPQTTMTIDSPWVENYYVNEVGETLNVAPGHAFISPWNRLVMDIDSQCPHDTVIPIGIQVEEDQSGRSWNHEFFLHVEDFRGPEMWDYLLSDNTPDPESSLDISVECYDVSGIQSLSALIIRYGTVETYSVDLEHQTGNTFSATMDVPLVPGDFIVNLIAVDDRGNTQINEECLVFSSIHLESSDILIVNQGETDGGIRIQDALTSLGYSCGHWDVRFRGESSFEEIKSIEPGCVFFLFGQSGKVGSEKRIMIDNLISDGAGIVMSGWDFLVNTKRSGGDSWLQTRFGVSVQGRDTGFYKVEDIPESGIYGDVTARLKKKLGDDSLNADQIVPVEAGVSVLEFTGMTTPTSGAIACRDTGFRSIVYPFGLEHAKTDQELIILLEPIISYLTDHPTSSSFNLTLNQTHYSSDDLFELDAEFINADPILLDTDIFVALEIEGDFWFWPSWINLNDGVDYGSISVDPFDTWQESILSFQWPQIDEVGMNVGFYGAALDQYGNLIGSLSTATFGF